MALGVLTCGSTGCVTLTANWLIQCSGLMGTSRIGTRGEMPSPDWSVVSVAGCVSLRL